MSCTKTQLFDSLVSMTSARNRRALETSLVSTLNNLLVLKSIVLLRVPLGNESSYFEVATSIPQIEKIPSFKVLPLTHGDQCVESSNLLVECISYQALAKSLNEGKTTLFFPVFNRNRVAGILCIEIKDITDDIEKTITGFVSVYNNFLAIAHDNEHDTLTGLLNRKTFDSQLSELLSSSDSDDDDTLCIERRTTKEQCSHWMSLLDIDFFKRVNDTFGHVYGDEVLLIFSNIMTKSFRSSDILFRYGGEEFVVVLSPANSSDAMAVFERFRLAVEQYNFPKIGSITVSIGVASLDNNDHPTTILEYADEALYFAKGNGRNQVSNYHVLIDQKHLKAKTVNSDVELF